MNANYRNFALWVIIFLLVLALVTLFQSPGQKAPSSEITFSQLLTDADAGNVRDVTIAGPEISGHMKDGRSFQTYAPSDPGLVQMLYKKDVTITAKPPSDGNNWVLTIVSSVLPVLLFLGLWIYMTRQMQGGAGKAMGFGKSKAKLLTEAQGRVTFEDVAGVDEAKEDLQEIVEFLRDPREVPEARGRIPRGVLLVGPPGTGKTLTARAVAGEANVPFFTFRVPTSSKCSSVSARAVCATCSNRERRTRLASFSSMKSTRLAVIAALVSAVAMTSASRRSISCSSRWTASSRTKALSLSRRPTGPTCLTQRCSGLAASIVRS